MVITLVGGVGWGGGARVKRKTKAQGRKVMTPTNEQPPHGHQNIRVTP